MVFSVEEEQRFSTITPITFRRSISWTNESIWSSVFLKEVKTTDIECILVEDKTPSIIFE